MVTGQSEHRFVVRNVRICAGWMRTKVRHYVCKRPIRDSSLAMNRNIRLGSDLTPQSPSAWRVGVSAKTVNPERALPMGITGFRAHAARAVLMECSGKLAQQNFEGGDATQSGGWYKVRINVNFILYVKITLKRILLLQ